MVFALNQILSYNTLPDELKSYYIYLLDTMPLQRMIIFAIAGVSGFVMMVGIVLRNRADRKSESIEQDNPAA